MLFINDVEQGWKILLAIGAGTGSVLILRWYWSRINAWSELSAMAASFVTALFMQYGMGYDAADPSGVGYAVVMLVTVAVTTVVWITVTLLTPAEPLRVLQAFYRRVRPGYGDDRIPGGALSWLNWVAGCVAVYGALAAVGELLVGTALGATLWSLAAVVSFAIIARNLRADKTFRAPSVDTSTVPQ
jgi:hypothetical protein